MNGHETEKQKVGMADSMNRDNLKPVPQQEGWWKQEFQYLLDRKILSRDELAYLFGQIKSIIEQELSQVQRLRKIEQGAWEETKKYQDIAVKAQKELSRIKGISVEEIEKTLKDNIDCEYHHREQIKDTAQAIHNLINKEKK